MGQTQSNRQTVDQMVLFRAENPPVASSYFDWLQAQSEHEKSVSFRTQTEIDNNTHGSPPNNDVSYDATEDAAKVTIPTNTESLPLASQVRPEFTDKSSGNLLITWDGKWDASFQDERDIVHTQKTFQVGDTGGSSGGRAWETRMRFGQVSSPSAANVDVRVMGSVSSPGTAIDPLAPQDNTFTPQENEWARFWVYMEHDSGGNEWTCSMWCAREGVGKTQLFDAIPCDFNLISKLNWFWFEYNTSQEPRVGGEMIAWFRNWAVLFDISNDTRLQAIIDQGATVP